MTPEALNNIDIVVEELEKLLKALGEIVDLTPAECGEKSEQIWIDYEHILSPLIKINCERGQYYVAGFHHDWQGEIQASGIIKSEVTKQFKNGVYEIKWSYEKKKNYIRLEKKKGIYFRKNKAERLLEVLAILFTDGGYGVLWFKDELLNSESRGIYGELTHVSIQGKKVVLEPTLTDDPEEIEEYTIEIDRNVLLRLTSEWEDLTKKNAPEIFIARKDGELFVTDILPEGIALAKLEA